MTMVSSFFARAAQHPERIAIVEPGGARVSYRGLARMVCDYAAYFRSAGVGSGDRILVTLKVEIPLYASLYALWSLGAVVVFPEPAMGLTGLRHAAGIRIDAWLAPPVWRAIGLLFPELRRIRRGLSPPAAGAGARSGPLDADRLSATVTSAAAVADEAPGLIFFTSGSTGRPKAIVYTHTFIKDQGRGLEPLFRPNPGEVDLVAFPLFVLECLDLGSTNVLPNWDLRKPRDASLDAILRYARAEGVTRLLLQPALCERLVDKAIPPAVRAVLTGGGPVFPDLLRRLADKVPEVYSIYGSTEAEPIAHITAADITPADWAAMDAGAGILTGPPVSQVRVRIVDDEIQVTGPNVNKGYLDPAQNASTKQIDGDGVVWHRTGDAGRIDAQGRLWLLGRLEGRIGGLFPFGVEAIARRWPDVRSAALCAGPGGRPVLALTGAPASLDGWRRRARELGIDQVVLLDDMPLDRRHASKIEYVRLRRLLEKASATR
jgi:acyl-CoA synthetase (AMP-forming)/AMP-acid ligase II